MIEASIFTSVEFYTIAVTAAILIVGFIFNPSRQSPALTYIYAATIEPAKHPEATDGSGLTIESLDDGTLLVVRRGVQLPEGSTAHVDADLIDDKLTLTEKHHPAAGDAPMAPHDISVRVDCLKAKRYHLRYEVPDSGLWGVATIVNHDNFSTTASLQL